LRIPLETVDYIIDFLAGFSVSKSDTVFYGSLENIPRQTILVIKAANISMEQTSLPDIPVKKFDEIPLLFGEAKVERNNGKLVVHADIIASSFFLLSRYEEILKPECRDQHGRFLAKDSIIFQQGYGNRPLVDEYGDLLRKWLREIGVPVPPEKQGFSKIYLTHDVDNPFRFERFNVVCKQYIKNMLHYNYCGSPLKKYIDERHDDFYTFPAIIGYDRCCKEKLPRIPVESIYFMISAGSLSNRRYYNFNSRKTDRLMRTLEKSGAVLGLHLSYGAGADPREIHTEVTRFAKSLGSYSGFSRHHYLQWREPEDVVYMEQAGITDDFTLSYADAAGFRAGTCRPYRFINPCTKTLANVMIHPLEIMDCSLDSESYMHLGYEEALEHCRNIIKQVDKHHGELVLLWHNTEFLGLNYQEKLYKSILDYITEL
jgi:hypothetical protein